LLRQTSRVLLDHQAPAVARKAITDSIESMADNRVADLHLWSIGPGIYAAIIGVVTDSPKPPDVYRQLLPADLGIVHLSVEVHRCAEPPRAREVA
jgi:Co/Zn/Cd efflux system component